MLLQHIIYPRYILPFPDLNLIHIIFSTELFSFFISVNLFYILSYRLWICLCRGILHPIRSLSFRPLRLENFILFIRKHNVQVIGVFKSLSLFKCKTYMSFSIPDVSYQFPLITKLFRKKKKRNFYNFTRAL